MDNGRIQNRTALLKAQLHELSKSFVLLDAQDRPWKVYSTRTDAKDGDPCLITIYEYKDASSSLIIKRKEDEDVWVSATMEVIP